MSTDLSLLVSFGGIDAPAKTEFYSPPTGKSGKSNSPSTIGKSGKELHHWQIWQELVIHHDNDDYDSDDGSDDSSDDDRKRNVGRIMHDPVRNKCNYEITNYCSMLLTVR